MRMSIQTEEKGQLGGSEGENSATCCLQRRQALQGQRLVEPGWLAQVSAEELQFLGQKGVG